MKLLLFCALVAGAQCVLADRRAVPSMSGSWSSPRKHLLGIEQCSRGPTYWCQRIQHARQCSAMSHCIQTVWSKTAEPEDNAVECRWCDELMGDIRGLAKTNTSKTSMRGYLKEGCKRNPGSSDRAACLEQLSMNLGEIRQMVEAGVPDRVVCQLMGYCEACEVAPEVSRIEPSFHNARNTCRDCYNFFEDAKEMYLGNYTEVEYKSMLVQQCQQAGYPAITELCKMVIEQYWPQIYARLEFSFDPAQTCYQINFCNATNSNSKAKTTTPWSILTSRVRGSDAANQPQQLPINRMLLNVGSPPSITNAKVANSKFAILSAPEFVMTYVDRMQENSYTEANIEHHCRVFVEKYVPAILVILGNELDPAMLCSGLKLCDQNKPTKQVWGPATCTACTEVFQAIKTLLKSYEETARLAEMIKGFCELYPGGSNKNWEDDLVVIY